MLEFLNKLLGNKSGRDMKTLSPRVPEILAAYDKLQVLTNDQLRGKSAEFRGIIAHDLKEIDEERDKIQSRLDNEPEMDPVEKDTLFHELRSEEHTSELQSPMYL